MAVTTDEKTYVTGGSGEPPQMFPGESYESGCVKLETLNRRAMQLDVCELAGAIKEAGAQKRDLLARQDNEYGENRVKISSYLENIALPDIFGFDMNDYYRDPELALELDLRHTLFWLDNSHDDGVGGLGVSAGIMYYDMTLFGLVIDHQRNGVPVFRKHALEDAPELSQLSPFDFETSGMMPMVLRRYNEFTRISKERYNGEISVGFPVFTRGPLDIAIQLRGYENFIADCAEDPDYVHALFDYIVSERLRFNHLAAAYRPPVTGEKTSFAEDDWVNVPFITPDMFSEFVVPAYRRIQENEGRITGFHTCGQMLALVDRLMAVFSGIKTLEVSYWNDIEKFDEILDRDVAVHHPLIPSFVLFASPEEHEARLAAIRRVRQHRRVSIATAAVVQMHGTLDETLGAMNHFIDLARVRLAD